MSVLIIGIVLSFSIIVSFFALIRLIFGMGLAELMAYGWAVLTFLFGSEWALIFIAMFGLSGSVLLIRFVMSWLGENPGHSANT